MLKARLQAALAHPPAAAPFRYQVQGLPLLAGCRARRRYAVHKRGLELRQLQLPLEVILVAAVAASWARFGFTRPGDSGVLSYRGLARLGLPDPGIILAKLLHC